MHISPSQLHWHDLHGRHAGPALGPLGALMVGYTLRKQLVVLLLPRRLRKESRQMETLGKAAAVLLVAPLLPPHMQAKKD